MAPAYKLTYFDGRGLAETCRFLFKYGGIEFEDCRVKREDWPQVKKSTYFFILIFLLDFIIHVLDYTWGQLPVLEHKGKTVNQSLSITRYLGKQVKLAGNDDWENLEIDAIADTINDLRLSKLNILF